MRFSSVLLREPWKVPVCVRRSGEANVGINTSSVVIPQTEQQQPLLVLDEGVSFINAHNANPKKRNCGCSSAITISTPKQTLYTHGNIVSNDSKERAFQNLLKDTRPARTVQKHQNINSFWNNFKKRCSQQSKKSSKGEKRK